MPDPMIIRSVTWTGLTLTEAQAVEREAFATYNPEVTVYTRPAGDIIGGIVRYDVDTDGLTFKRIQAIGVLLEELRTPETPDPTAGTTTPGSITRG